MTAMQAENALWRFVVVGLGNTVLGLSFIYGARALGLGDVAANAVGYATGLALSFGLNRSWTFKHRGPWLPHLAKFTGVMMLAWLANLAALLQLINGGVPAILAQACAVLPYTFVCYIGCRWWVFTNRSSSQLE